MTSSRDGLDPSPSRWFSPALCAVILLLVPAVLLLPAIGPGRTVGGIDFINVFYFTRRFVVQQMSAGHLPTWNPWVLCGFPLLAALQAAVFYPPSWLELLLPAAAFWTVAAWLHVVLSGSFAFAWLRRGLGLARCAALAGAMTFALSGYLFTRVHAGHINYVWAYPWGACALWRLERWLAAPSLRRAVLLGLPLPLMVLAGVPQLAFAAGLAVALRLAHHLALGEASRTERVRDVAGGLAALACGLGLTAPQILPTVELIAHAQRGSIAGPSFADSFALPPENLLAFLAPSVFGDAVGTRYWGRWYLWEACGYVGAVGLVLAAVGGTARHPQRSLWIGTAVLAVMVALGPATPLFSLFRTLVPGASSFRGPGRYLYVFVLALAVLVGLGVQRVVTGDAAARRTIRRVGGGTLLVAVLLAAAATALAIAGSGSSTWQGVIGRAGRARAEWSATSGVAPLPVDDPEFREASHRGAVAALGGSAVWTALASFVLLGTAAARLPARAAVTALVVLLVADLASFDRRYVWPVALDDLAWPEATVALLRGRVGDDFRLTSMLRGDVADAGRAELARVAHAGGYEPLLLQRYAELVNVANGLPPDRLLVLATLSRPHPIAAMLGAHLWLAPSGMSPPPGLRAIPTPADESPVFAWRQAVPRASLVPRSVVEPDPKRRLALLAREDWAPRTTVVLEDDPHVAPDDLRQAGAPGSVSITERAPGRYVVDVDAPGGGYLVLAEAWFPGWSATLDGAPVDLLRANHLVQAVRVPAGAHRVTFAYHSRPLRIGITLAVATMLVPCGVALATRRRRATVRERSAVQS